MTNHPARTNREAWLAARPTTCPRGHPWDEANTRLYGNGYRACRRCDLERVTAKRARARASKTEEGRRSS